MITPKRTGLDGGAGESNSPLAPFSPKRLQHNH